ncbi:MAG: winged helix-turn-helix transcriptional regulator [Lachnospiraceae bacterium]|nr:winged helix-turn-helix transcriptional regulator [Lachnospiraceae bacterium]MDE7272377.1 winged helix-turn-helix transcriptional regulator [Lachnospiraceae bacterium]
MKKNTFEKLHRINYLGAEMEALYHQASLRFGISDSALRALYTVYDNGGTCLLSDIYKQSGISKQTVNSAIRKLENEGILYLDQESGRGKRVHLTDKGKDYVENNVARLYAAECEIFASWSEEEIDSYIRFMEKYNELFRAQLEQM